ncbi:MAG: branched-chain amino acid ABC transporter permease [Anaerolineae bacterium]|nr:branched-chain amino acid ABC transporter permease [Anaerolineae bacterium]
MVSTILLQTVLNGVLQGGLYGLIALGLSLIWGVMRVVNIAHGEFLMLGAFITYFLFAPFGLNPFLSALISGPTFFFVGLVVYRFLVRRTVGAPELISLLLTFGISIFILNAAILAWTADIRAVGYTLPSVQFSGLIVPLSRLYAFIAAVLLTLSFFVFLAKTYLGKAIKALTQNREAAHLVGINTERVSMIAFGLGLAFAATAGSINTVANPALTPMIGSVYVLKAFAIVVLGGVGRPFGALAGGFLLALAESFGTVYWHAEASVVVAFLVLLITLYLKPSGLLGRKE